MLVHPNGLFFAYVCSEEYHRIVALMTQQDVLDKIALLRKTAMFTTMDLFHLREIAKVMEPRTFR